MIKAIEFPNKSFSSQAELFKALRENADKIIDLKCAEIQKSCDKGHWGVVGFLDIKSDAAKAFSMKSDCIYPVINTTKYLDSHKDVHLDGIWNKSVKEQNGRVYYVCDHDLKMASVIAYPTDVNVMLKNIPWGMVGKDFEGETQALIYEIPLAKIKNDVALDAIEEKRPVQNSVRMRYIKIKLALNSTAKEDIEYKKTYEEVYPMIANKSDVDKGGYFWAVYEAKIEKEGSMVLFGSNDATPIMSGAVVDTPDNEHKNEPPSGTQNGFYQEILNNLKN